MSRHSPDFHPALRVLHWLLAAMVLAMLFIGVGMVSTAGPLYPLLLSLHRPIGIAILLLVLIRLPLRLLTGAPALPADLPPLQARLAKASHVLLYASMIALPLIGWAMLSAGIRCSWPRASPCRRSCRTTWRSMPCCAARIRWWPCCSSR